MLVFIQCMACTYKYLRRLVRTLLPGQPWHKPRNIFMHISSHACVLQSSLLAKTLNIITYHLCREPPQQESASDTFLLKILSTPLVFPRKKKCEGCFASGKPTVKSVCLAGGLVCFLVCLVHFSYWRSRQNCLLHMQEKCKTKKKKKTVPIPSIEPQLFPLNFWWPIH